MQADPWKPKDPAKGGGTAIPPIEMDMAKRHMQPANTQRGPAYDPSKPAPKRKTTPTGYAAKTSSDFSVTLPNGKRVGMRKVAEPFVRPGMFSGGGNYRDFSRALTHGEGWKYLRTPGYKAPTEALKYPGVMKSLGRVGKAGKFLGKAVPGLGVISGYAGGAEGEGFLKGLGTSAAVGGAAGALFGGVGAIPGAVAGAATYAGGRLLHKLNPFSDSPEERQRKKYLKEIAAYGGY